MSTRRANPPTTGDGLPNRPFHRNPPRTHDGATGSRTTRSAEPRRAGGQTAHANRDIIGEPADVDGGPGPRAPRSVVTNLEPLVNGLDLTQAGGVEHREPPQPIAGRLPDPLV